MFSSTTQDSLGRAGEVHDTLSGLTIIPARLAGVRGKESVRPARPALRFILSEPDGLPAFSFRLVHWGTDDR